MNTTGHMRLVAVIDQAAHESCEDGTEGGRRYAASLRTAVTAAEALLEDSRALRLMREPLARERGDRIQAAAEALLLALVPESERR